MFFMTLVYLIKAKLKKSPKATKPKTRNKKSPHFSPAFACGHVSIIQYDTVGVKFKIHLFFNVNLFLVSVSQLF